MLGVFAEFETNIRKERQMEGIAKAKTKGVYKGRERLSSAVKDKIRQFYSEGVKPVDIVKQLGVGRTSVYNMLKGHR
jgi:DNA invertase Pin-like site-specific DNA recombinase